MAQSSTRRDFMKTASVAALSYAASPAWAGDGTQPARRNIIFILIDDLRFDGMGMLNPFFETPTLDALARNGVLFDKAFVTTSLCSPSRASILSGQYAHRHGVLDNNTLLPKDTPTFPQELKRGGYRTGFVGKWHMGASSDAPQPGFDRWVGFKGQGNYRNQTFNVDGKEVPSTGYITDMLTDYAVDFLRQPSEAPFFLYLSHKAVHAEFDPPDRYQGSYSQRDFQRPVSMADTEENYAGKPAWVRAQRNSWHGVDGMYNKKTDFDTFVRRYAETMRGVDDSVARIVATLSELGRLEDTLIVFTSDNGFQFGEHGLIDKRTMYEASIRVPLLAHCPGLFKGGLRRQEQILNIDLAPTLIEAAGLRVPDTMQGTSFHGLLTGERSDWREDWLYEYFWERSFPQTPSVLGVRSNHYKFMQYHGIWDRYELYDLEKDPDEKHNLLGDFMVRAEGGPLDALIRGQAPEPVRGVFLDMKKRLERLLEETGCAPEPTWRPQLPSS